MAKSGYPNSFESTGTLVAHRTGEMLHPTSSSQRFAFNPILIGGLILYVCAFAILLQRKGFDASGAVVVLIVFLRRGSIPRGPGFLLHSQRSLSFSSRYLS